MADPSRLRSNAGSVEALLLKSARDGEPPPSAEDEVWRRVEALTAAGAAAAATGIAVQSAAAGAKAAKGAFWLSTVKWTAAIAFAVPAAGLAAHWVVHRQGGSVEVAQGPTAAPAVSTGSAPAAQGSPGPQQALAPVETAPDVPRAAAPAAHGHGAVGTAASAEDTPSALRKESLALGSARGKFASGDARGALDDVARMAAELPRGRLVQEREVLALDCLAALGERDAARTRALAFIQRFPASPYLAHVRQLVDR